MDNQCEHIWMVIEWEFGNIPSLPDEISDAKWEKSIQKDAQYQRARIFACQKCSNIRRWWPYDLVTSS